MRWAVAALLVLVFGMVLAPVDAATSVVVGGGTGRQRALVEESVRSFEQAGLDLPPVRISFRGPHGCGGNEGRYRAETGITVCAPHPELERRVLIHELAHAWMDTELTEAHRQALVALRGLPSWNDEGHEWRHRGNEHAAEILTWSLIRHPILMVRIPDKSCQELGAGYRLLTGRAPVPDESTCPIH